VDDYQVAEGTDWLPEPLAAFITFPVSYILTNIF
jgi:hypothetical protein